MKCQTCGAEIEASATFCHVCGARLDQQEPGQRGAPAATTAPAAVTPAAAPAATDEARERSAAVFQPKRAESGTATEEEIWEGGYSPKAMIGAWVTSGVITVALIVAGFIFALEPVYWLAIGGAIVLLWGFHLARLAYRRLGIHYRLTSRRFFHEEGILRRVTNRIEAIDIDDVTAEQGFFERMVGVGTIHIISSDRTHPELVMPGIDDVKRIAQRIDEVRRAERERRGVYIEHV